MTIYQNDWAALAGDAEQVAAGTEVSVIIPAHCDQQMLDLCLAALGSQTLPFADFEVIVVDHKSEPALHLPPDLPTGFRVTLGRLDTGDGPGAARAYGATVASGNVFVFIDVDILSSADMIRQYARMPSHDASVVTLGFRQFLDPDGVSPDGVRAAIAEHALMDFVAQRPATEGQEWIDAFLSRSDDGLAWRDDLWLVVVGAGIGVSRKLYTLAGGFRDFPVHGVEDTEFGWRLFQAGGVIAPNRDAVGVHWGLRSISLNRAEIMRRREGFLANLIAHNRYRVPHMRRAWSVPKLLVQVLCKPGSSAEDLVQTCHDLLLSSEHDVLIEVTGEQNLLDRDLAHSWLDSESRIHFSGTDGVGVPESIPYVLRVSAGVRFEEKSVSKMFRELDQNHKGLLCVVAAVDAVTAELWRTTALARASFFAPDGGKFRDAVRSTTEEAWLPGDRIGVGYLVGVSDAEKVGGRWSLGSSK